MSETASTSLMTAEEFLALPDDGIERDLIRGEVRVRGEGEMTRRNRWHCRIVTRIAALLYLWLIEQPEPRGDVLTGEAGFILRRNPDSTVGIDVAYVSAEVLVRQTDETTLVEGVPVLAAEVLSPSDKQEEITEKVEDFLNAGVQLVWIVDPWFRTVTVYRPDAEPRLFNVEDELSADPHLPGFRVPVAKVFE